MKWDVNELCGFQPIASNFSLQSAQSFFGGFWGFKRENFVTSVWRKLRLVSLATGAPTEEPVCLQKKTHFQKTLVLTEHVFLKHFKKKAV
jgi:hypothetical protein